MTIKEFFSIKKNPFFWGNIIAMIIVALLLVFVVLKTLDSHTRHGKAIVVPDAKGMGVTRAQLLFQEKGLLSIVADSVYVKDKPAGSVIDHIPASGQRVKQGRVIYLTINTQYVPLQPVPDVADNSSLRQAEARILASGFKLTVNEMISGEQDWVYDVKYNGRVLLRGEKVPIGATLTLVVGNGTKGAIGNDSIPEMEGDSATDESWF